MNKYLIVLLVSFLFLSCKKTEIMYFENGKISSKCEFRGKKRDGKSIWYHENGKMQSEFNYKNGVLNGISRSFSIAGKLERVSHYVNGLQEGILLEYNESGVLQSETHYKKGQKDGNCKLYYPLEGRIKMEGNFSNGLYDGKWTIYDVYGRTIGEGNFKHGNGYIIDYKTNNTDSNRHEYKKNELIRN